MSDLTFAQQFADWEWLLRDDGETSEGIAEIKRQIRDDWSDLEKRALWEAFVKERSDFRQELIAMGRGLSDRIKAQMKLREAA